MADDATAGRDEETVPGRPRAKARLAQLCRAGTRAPLTLDRIETTLQRALDANAQMIGRVTRSPHLAREILPGEVPLETAAEALYLACDPILQEALVAAMELLGLSLNQVILGSLSFNRQELVNQDQSLIPQASLVAQFGPRWR